MQVLINTGNSHPNIAYVYALVGNTFLAIMQIFTKYATAILSSFQLLSIRSFFLIWFGLWVIRSVNRSPYVPSSQCIIPHTHSLQSNFAQNHGGRLCLDIDVFLFDKNTGEHSDHYLQYWAYIHLLH